MEINRQYQSLIENLDRFIRKYYTNQAIRGGIFSVIYVLGFFLAINLLEYYLYLSPILRKVLFFGFIGSSAAFIGRFFVTPLLIQRPRKKQPNIDRVHIMPYHCTVNKWNGSGILGSTFQ